jgi:MFS family permease
METPIAPAPAPIKKKLADPVLIIERAWKTYKLTFKRLWVLFLFGGMGNLGLRYSGSSSHSSSSLSGSSATPDAMDFFSNIPWEVWVLIGVAILLFSLFLLWSKIALFKSISDIRKGEFHGVKKAYGKSLKLFFPFIFLSLIWGFVSLGSFLLFVVPGIILSGYLVFGQLEFFDKNKRGFAALLASWSLLTGYWWAVWWRAAVMALLMGFAAFIAILGTVLIGGLIIFALSLLHNSVVFFTFIAILAIAVFAAVYLLFEPVAILMLFELYYDLSALRADEGHASTHALDSKRKMKLMASMWFGIVAVVALISLGFFLYPKVKTFIDENTPSVPASFSHALTYEDPADFYTIDYPSTWRIASEYATTSPSYIHTVSFSPNSNFDKIHPTTTSSLDILSEFSDQTLEQAKTHFLSSLLETQNVEIRELTVASSTSGYFPSYDITFIEKDVIPATLFHASSSVEYKSFTRIVVRGHFLYMVVFSGDIASFDARMKDVSAMLDTWYLYYTQATKGAFKTYANHEYGIQMAYPKEWFQVAARPEEAVVAQFESNVGGSDDPNIIAVLAEQYPGGIEAYKNKLNTRIGSMATPITLGGMSGYQIVRSPEETVHGYVITDFIEKNGIIYALLFQGIKPNDPLITSITNSFAFSVPLISDVAPAGYTTHENRQFGFSVAVPKKWIPTPGVSIPDLIVDSYLIPGPEKDKDAFKGVFKISVPDDYYFSTQYPIERYRDDSLAHWKKGTDSVKDFMTLKTGTTTVQGLSAAYYIGSYTSFFKADPSTPVYLKAKQLFIQKDGLVRWITYIDDEKDFDINIAEVDQAMQTILIR